jgi:hypothetical protein
MTLKVRIKRPLFQSMRPKYGGRALAFATEGGNRVFLDTLTECAGTEQIEALRNQQVQRLPHANPAPEVSPALEAPPVLRTSKTPRANSAAKASATPKADAPPSALSRAFSWLQKRYTLRATRQLRVSETVSLGEKRFVAILHVEDRKFLIGGGASNVALLTQLDAVTESAAASQPLPRLHGVC